MPQKTSQKLASRQKILNAGAARLREEGLAGAGISAVMQDAGLTHGAFYAHFRNKDDMLAAAFRHALAENRSHWTSPGNGESWPDRLHRLAGRYLTRRHRDDLSTGCAIAALLSDAARADEQFRIAYEEELLESLDAICGERPCDAALDPDRFNDAVRFFALCAGGISLARAVADPEISDRILSICREAAGQVHEGGGQVREEPVPDSSALHKAASQSLSFNQYPLRSREKIRYTDTDRQGHVNNTVFSAMLETSRVELLYHPERPLAAPGCSFAIASQKLEFLSQLTWPGWANIGTRVLRVGRSSLTLESVIMQDETRAAMAEIIIVQINNRTERSHPLSPETRQYLKSFMSSSGQNGGADTVMSQPNDEESENE
jgi:TetR/AcrR family transcriptional repressor of nem operon